MSLPSRLEPSELNSFMQETQADISEKSPRHIWHRFHALFHSHPDLANDFPEAVRYADYILGFQNIDHAALFEEVRRIEQGIRNNLADADPSITDVVRCHEALGVLGNMFELRATPEDYDSYIGYLGDGRYTREEMGSAQNCVDDACTRLGVDSVLVATRRSTSARTFRRYFVSDRKPIVEREHEIRQHDLTDGLPKVTRC